MATPRWCGCCWPTGGRSCRDHRDRLPSACACILQLFASALKLCLLLGFAYSARNKYRVAFPTRILVATSINSEEVAGSFATFECFGFFASRRRQDEVHWILRIDFASSLRVRVTITVVASSSWAGGRSSSSCIRPRSASDEHIDRETNIPTDEWMSWLWHRRRCAALHQQHFILLRHGTRYLAVPQPVPHWHWRWLPSRSEHGSNSRALAVAC